MVAIARKTHQNNMSFIMLAGRYTNIIASFYAYIYIVLVLLSPIYLVPMVLDSNMLSSSFHRVVPWTNLFLKGPDSMTHACPKLFYFFCVCGTSDMSSTWAQHAFFSRGFPLYYLPVEGPEGWRELTRCHGARDINPSGPKATSS